MDAQYKPFAVELYLKQADQYPEERKAEYLKYIKSQNANLLLSFISEKKTESVLALLNTKLVSPSSIEKGIRAATGNAEMTAILLDYQEKYVDLQKEREKESKKLYAALNHVETDTEQLKKKFNYKKQEDGTLTITNYKGNEIKVTVPEKIGKSAVTAIEAYAFSPFAPRCKNQGEREHITEIVFPKTISVIKDNAFCNCRSLTSVTISGSISSIKDFTFWGCTSLASITIPDGVISIGGCAFSHCTSLASVAIPGSVSTIGAGAFQYCTSLVSITIPDSVTSIGDSAFRGCKSLVEVKLPKDVQLGYNVFSGTKVRLV